MSNAASHDKIRRMTGISILLAVVVVLTLLGNFVRFGPFPITLALAPIIIGAAVYGPSAGAILGFAFSLVVFITGVMGWDGGTVMLLMSASPVACVLVCLAKGTVAGWLAGLLYELLSKVNVHLGVVAAGIICPVTNTGIFVAGMLLFFNETLASWAGGQPVLSYIIFGLTGVNFLVELAVNLVLASGITSIIKHVGGKKA